MNKSLFLALFLGSSSLFGYEECCLDRHITFQADYGYIRRQDVRDLRLVENASILIDENGNMKPKKVMDTDDLAERLGWQSAIRALTTVHCTPSFSFEIQYTYYFPWTATNVVTGTGLQFPFTDLSLTVDYVGADRVVGNYKSKLQNGEVNLWFHLTPQRVDYFSFAWVFGARGMDLKENMNLEFYHPSSRSKYQIQDKDHLIGPQLGAMLQVNPTSCWTWTFIVKGAGFFNRIKNEVCVKDRNNTDKIIGFKKKRSTDSWLLEAYGQLAFNIWTNFDIHIGYQGFILTGIGLAPNNRTVYLPQRRTVNGKGQIVIDGLYAGASLSF